MIVIPEAFLNRMHELHGEQGDAWSSELPGLIAECASRFDFRPESPFSNLSYNFVLRGKRGDGKPAVLKCSYLKDELAREVNVLRAYESRGAVGVLEADEELGVALLEGADPGTPLSSIEDDLQATNIFCEVFHRLQLPAPSGSQYPTMKQHFAAMERYRERYEGVSLDAPLPESWVENAEECLAYLISTTEENLLLHGDLHHQNILRQGEEQWSVIDPKGVIGDIHFDTIQYLLNYEDRGGDCEVVLRRRIAIMAGRLGLDPRRIAMWGVARGVLEACWTLEDGGTDWQAGIAITERFANCLN
ncbi:aminoglycoside phosphotransferase family protein [Paenibacillus sacheonensis]|uniref:Phosphotransferase n=1 Tax=Paenibacillus sacheonensis TaxID=742054 RepID=A0A7X4YMW6_9BACL|nr:aminoglycoside phosphotransferase family protein [Paenibacillus sacheonensis]MBM7564755.1 streptomycin 6-kinase [Paenibacillus sacheonensis]NBC69307.1 phosphotransferase [Paenibacillus sacheonensis]